MTEELSGQLPMHLILVEKLMNPFDWTGENFLLLFVSLLLAAFPVSWLVQHLMYLSASEPGGKHDLDPYEAATLQSGRMLAVEAALARLIHEGSLTFDSAQGQVRRAGKPVDRDPHPLEDAVLALVPETAFVRVDSVCRQAMASAGPLRDRLTDEGLLISPTWSFFTNLTIRAIFLLLVGFGSIKIAVGLFRDRPVLILLGLVLVACWFVIRPPFGSRRLSPRGVQALADSRQKNAALQHAPDQPPANLNGADLALAIGLFGMAMVPPGPLRELRPMTSPAESTSVWGSSTDTTDMSSCSSSSSSCSSSSDSSSCGSSSSCGGCGGGGGD